MAITPSHDDALGEARPSPDDPSGTPSGTPRATQDPGQAPPSDEKAPGPEEGDTTPAGVHPPRQERSRRTMDRIVRAALALVAERGVEGASVQEIVDRAGSSVGSFYARFDGKDDLVRYLEERVWGEALERWDAGVASGEWSDAPLPELIRGIVSLLLRIERTDAAGRRALATRSRRPGGGPPGAEAFRRHIAGDVRELLEARPGDVGHRDPALAADVLFRALMGGVRELSPRLDESTLVTELTRMGLAYLGGAGESGGAAAEQTSMDFFDVWA